MDVLVRVGVVVLGGEAPHEITIVSAHHLLHVLEMMGLRRALGSTQGRSIWRRAGVTRRGGRHAPRRRRVVVGRESFRFNLQRDTIVLLNARPSRTRRRGEERAAN